MTLVCLALLFLLKERRKAQLHTPLLSARDIVELLAIYLPADHAMKPKCCVRCSNLMPRASATSTTAADACAPLGKNLPNRNKVELGDVY